MLKQELIDLSKYRLEKANDMVNAALRDRADGDYRTGLTILGDAVTRQCPHFF